MTLKKDIKTLKGKDIPKHIQFWKSKEIERVAKLKGWETIYESRLMLRYKNNKNGNILEIYPEKIKGKSVYFIAVTDKDYIRDKEFKTKPQAVKFAKEYMKKN